MIRHNFKKVSREQLTKLAINAINALSDKRNFSTFTLTLDVDGDESCIEVVKPKRAGHHPLTDPRRFDAPRMDDLEPDWYTPDESDLPF